MFQKASQNTARFTIPYLVAGTMLALGGCAGLQMDADSTPERASTGGYEDNQTLAVLLPQSGRFASAAAVVREGIVAAREADPAGKRPALRFYDSTDGAVLELVERAAAQGASLAIGPLQKPAVNELAKSSSLPIPVLALNQSATEAASPRNLYQFALSPEGEATQVAAKAWAEGHRKALVLYPEGNWGNRISRAFRQEWKARGGTLAATRAYDPSAADYAGMVADVSAGAADADFLFLVATSNLAHRIWPQIRGRLGTELDVYTTSHIYSGRFDPQEDGGLVGLNFVEIPWLVKPAQGDGVSSKGLYGKLPRLYAMGVDAYRLGSRLERMAANPQVRIQGKTGILGMDSRRRIHRQLTLARIEADGPVALAAIEARPRGILTGAGAPGTIGPALAARESPRLDRAFH